MAKTTKKKSAKLGFAPIEDRVLVRPAAAETVCVTACPPTRTSCAAMDVPSGVLA